MSLMQLTALELGRLIQSRQVSVAEAVADALAQAEKKEKTIHAYITLTPEYAMKRAAQVQKQIDSGQSPGPLAGVPVAVKDNLCTEGIKTTCASRMLESFIPPYTAQAVASLEQAGAIIIGKTNMDEFAMGSTTETSAFGVTRNPWNTAHVPGGSSGGSCAAVAAEEVSFALGTDTGGSIRQPSAFCGVVGIKPTYGTVSRYGLIAYGSSLDQIGPVAKTTADCAAALEAIAGYDAKDSTSVSRSGRLPGQEAGRAGGYDFTAALIDDVKGLRIGIPNEYFTGGLDEEVKEAVLGVARTLEEKGALVDYFDLSLTRYAVPAYYVIACAEASSNLARFDGVKYGYQSKGDGGLDSMYRQTRSQGFGPEVKRRIMLGTFALSEGYYDAYYLKALKTKALIRQAFDRAFDSFDIILAPAAPTAAPRLGESLKDPIQMYLSDIYTVAANLAGLPGISIPCGVTQNGLPIGAQLIGNCFEEKKLIRAAYSFEQSRGCRRCPLAEKGGGENEYSL